MRTCGWSSASHQQCMYDQSMWTAQTLKLIFSTGRDLNLRPLRLQFSSLTTGLFHRTPPAAQNRASTQSIKCLTFTNYIFLRQYHIFMRQCHIFMRQCHIFHKTIPYLYETMPYLLETISYLPETIPEYLCYHSVVS